MTIKVSHHWPLYVGHGIDLDHLESPETWAILHAAKLPWHKEMLGHHGHAAPKDDPEYLVARRGDRMAINLIDVDDSRFIADAMIEPALAFISEYVHAGHRTFVHCNQGRSRSPVLALLWLGQHDMDFIGLPFEQAEALMKERVEDYAPRNGVRDYARARWGRA